MPHSTRDARLLKSIKLVWILLALLICASSVTGQEPEDVIRVRTDLVAIPVVVADSHGRRVGNLSRNDFSIATDSGRAKVDYFASGTERVALLFALDASGSARDFIALQREAAVALFSHFGQSSRVAVLRFGEVVRLVVGFTTNAEEAEAAFNLEAQANAGTAIFDGAAMAIRSFDGSGGFSMERRIVILMSDGFDTLSATKYQSVIESARKRGVSFYVIHFPLFVPRDGVLAPRPPSKGFRELAEETGGKYFRIGDAKTALDPHAKLDLAPIFQVIENDLRGQYVIGFYPRDADRDPRFHRVTVSLNSSPQTRRLRLQQFTDGYDLKP